MLFQDRRQVTARDGLPPTEVFSIRETRGGDLLVSTRLGLARESEGSFRIHAPPDPLGRTTVFDALEDSAGRLWLASTFGLSELRGGRDRIVIPGGPLIASAVVTLLEAKDGALWAGTYEKGLWRVRGEEKKLFTVADRLPSDQIRALYQDGDGDIWIGTFDGGLGLFRAGHFLKFAAKDGLLSDNIASIESDGDGLWLSTTRGLCRLSKRQLNEFAEHKLARLTPENYGVDDGLRSAQCAAYPTAYGGQRTADNRLWFTTNHGLAVLDRPARKSQAPAPMVHLVGMNADGREVDLSGPARLPPGNGRVQVRYDAIHLSAPERVQYSYRLAGLDADWVRAGNRRLVNYTSLGHGHYRFEVRAEAPGAPPAEASFAFDLLPHFYETLWFRLACAAPLLGAFWAAYRIRLRAIGNRFALVLEERARLAREIHDTLAQGFVGISSQLDAVAMCLPDQTAPARKHLDVARSMARHSLTEARRSVMDLRASMLDGRDLGAALESGARVWAAGSGVEVEVGVTDPPGKLPEEMEQNLLRIAQEAVTNAVKHAAARKIRIELGAEGRRICLRVADDGRGFDENYALTSPGGHFGLLGMRERAERLGGEMRLVSHPGEGTEVEVSAPLP
jgi:signal transduction histidine kinase